MLNVGNAIDIAKKVNNYGIFIYVGPFYTMLLTEMVQWRNAKQWGKVRQMR